MQLCFIEYTNRYIHTLASIIHCNGIVFLYILLLCACAAAFLISLIVFFYHFYLSCILYACSMRLTSACNCVVRIFRFRKHKKKKNLLIKFYIEIFSNFVPYTQSSLPHCAKLKCRCYRLSLSFSSLYCCYIKLMLIGFCFYSSCHRFYLVLFMHTFSLTRNNNNKK